MNVRRLVRRIVYCQCADGRGGFERGRVVAVSEILEEQVRVFEKRKRASSDGDKTCFNLDSRLHNLGCLSFKALIYFKRLKRMIHNDKPV